MSKRCPICYRSLIAGELTSTKFEGGTETLVCRNCGYEIPDSSSSQQSESSSSQEDRPGLLSSRPQADSEVCALPEGPQSEYVQFPASPIANKLGRLTLDTLAPCPFCFGHLSYRIRAEYVECPQCHYQEHWPRERVGQLRTR